jgi:probable phosphoglycerate mutase
MKAYAVRHGETEYNSTDTISGQADIPLNEKGMQQARELARELPAGITTIYSSDLIRCKQTTDILNEGRDLPITYDARLRERKAGSLEGQPWAAVDPDGEMKKMNRILKYDFRPYGGEAVAEVEERLRACIEDIKARSEGAVPLIVTSAGIIRLLHHPLHDEIRETVHNSSIHEFDL